MTRHATMTVAQTRAAMRKDERTMKLATTTTTPETAPAMTVADMLAMVELGTLDPTTAVVPESAIADRIAQAAAIARQAGEDAGASKAARAAAEAFGTNATAAAALPPGMVPVPAGTHDCGMAGCNHGAAHDGPSQPDRQLKLTCPCGTVVRCTHRALARAGSLTCGSGHTLTVDHTRRAYGTAAAAAK